MADRHDRQEDFDAAWARIVAELTSDSAAGAKDQPPGTELSGTELTGTELTGTELTGTEPSGIEPSGIEPSDDQADPDGLPGPGPTAAAAGPPPDAPSGDQPAPGSHAGLERLFEPLRRQRPEPPAPSPASPDAFVDNWEDEGHFTPPEPPEIPFGTPITRLGWAGTIGGPVILLLIVLTGWDPPRFVSIAAGLAFLAGFATLVWLLPESREDGWDDGARL